MNKENRFVNILTYLFFDFSGTTMFCGGAERYLIELHRLIRAMGYEVRIYQHADRDWVASYQDIKIEGIGSHGDMQSFYSRFHAEKEQGMLTIYSPFTLAPDAGAGKTIGISHGVYWDHPVFRPEEERLKIYHGIRNCDVIVSVDTNTVNWVRAEIPEMSQKLVHIPNFVDHTVFFPARESKKNGVVLYPRRLCHDRGFFMVSDLLPFFLNRYPGMEFHFVGTWQGGEEVSNKIEELSHRHGERIKFYMLPPERMREAYLSADIIIIPTLYMEGTSLSCIEAMACGKPVIATNVGGLTDLIIDGYNGLLISPDEDELKQALSTLMENEALRRELGHNAYHVSQKFSIEIWRRRWTELLLKILDASDAAEAKRSQGDGNGIYRQLIEKNRKVSSLISEKDSLQEQLGRTTVQLNETTLQLNQAVSERDQLQRELSQTSAQLSQTKAQLDQTTGRLTQANQTLESIYGTRTWQLYQALSKRIYGTRTGRLFVRILGRLFRSGVQTQGFEPFISPDAEQTRKTFEKVQFDHDFPVEKKIQYDVICLPIIDWYFRFQRPQQLLTQFAGNGSRVFYVQPDFIDSAQRTFLHSKIGDNIFGITLNSNPSLNIYRDALGGEDLKKMTGSMESLRRDAGIAEAVCFVQIPFWQPLARSLKERFGWKIIYDCMDEHAGFSTNMEKMLMNEELLAKESDLVIATSQTLYEKNKVFQKNVIRVPNGADFEHFSRLPANELLTHLRRPIIGYYGAVSDWFDHELTQYLAEKKKEWSFVFIGHTFGSSIDRLQELPNVCFLGEKPYGDLPKYLFWFDVCIIPFKINKLTEATNPVKFYEYISSGKPVVSTEIPELLPYRDYLYLAKNREEFLLRLEQAVIENNPEMVRRRSLLAKENTWEKRYETISSAISGIYPTVSLIMVTYNNLSFTKLCTESIFQKTGYPNVEIIVVDNGSSDGTGEYLLELSKKVQRVKVILNERNEGFARANNKGITASTGEFIVLLNNDTVLTRSWVTRLLRHLEDETIGMVGPVTNQCGNEARIDVPYTSVDEIEAFSERYLREHIDPERFDVKMLAMYCVAMRRRLIDEIGLLDERFEVGMFEDDDFSHRVQLKGYRVVCARDVFVHHFGLASFSRLGYKKYLRIFEKNKKKFEEKWGIGWERRMPEYPGKETEESVEPETALTPSAGEMGSEKIKRRNEADYRSYQERMKGEFKKRRYKDEIQEVFKQKNYRGIVFYPSLVEWNIPLFQRPHQIFRELSKRGYLVLFLTPNPIVDDACPLRQVSDNLFLIRDIDMLYSLREWPIILWISWTPNLVCREFFPNSRLVYDYIDELEVFGYYCQRMEKEHARLVEISDSVITTAENLYAEVKQKRPDALLVPNGVCLEDFKVVKDSIPADLAGIVAQGKPIVGYYGALAEWLDYDLINFACEECKDLNFVLIGPKLGESSKKLKLSGNLFLLGPKRYEDLKYYLKRFDVATIPFRTGRVADSTSPVKLFEYMAGGKPIVTTGMKECSKYRSVLVSKSYTEYLDNIRSALTLARDSSYISLLEREAAENTWASRVDAILKCQSF